MSFTIYLAEDENNLNQVLTTYLEKEGWKVTSFLTGEEAKQAITDPPHLWILDIMLPVVDGYQLINEIKTATPAVPVVFISARDKELDRVIGLEMGSDDYLVKPFLPRELVLRVHKLLNRMYLNPAPPSNPTSQQYIYETYLIDKNKRTVLNQNTPLDLTSKELDLLLIFLKNPVKAFSREEILTIIWGDNYFGSDRVVDDLVSRLRKKMPELRLETIYGYGYRLVSS